MARFGDAGDARVVLGQALLSGAPSEVMDAAKPGCDSLVVDGEVPPRCQLVDRAGRSHARLRFVPGFGIRIERVRHGVIQ